MRFSENIQFLQISLRFFQLVQSRFSDIQFYFKTGCRFYVLATFNLNPPFFPAFKTTWQIFNACLHGGKWKSVHFKGNPVSIIEQISVAQRDILDGFALFSLQSNGLSLYLATFCFLLILAVLSRQCGRNCSPTTVRDQVTLCAPRRLSRLLLFSTRVLLPAI